MATRMQQRRGTAAQWISTNSGNGPILNAGEIGFETDTNKFKIGDGTNHWVNLDYFIDASSTVNPAFGSSITFEGATANDFETTLAITDPTADRTITFQDATGTVVLRDSTDTLTNKTLTGPVVSGLTLSDSGIVFEGSSADAHETTLTVTNPTEDRTLTLPNSTGTIATQEYVDSSVSGAEVDQSTLAGTGINWNAGTSKFDVDTLTIQARVTDVTDTEIGYLNGVTSAIQTQMDAKAPLADPAFTGTATAVNLTVSGNLTVDGTTTNINSTNLVVEDKNIVLGDTASPTDTTADGGGITLKGATDKTFNWVDATDAWTSSEHVNLASGKTLKYNGTDLVASQSGNSGKYLTTDGTSTSWGTISGYSAPTLGSTSIASGATVTTISGLADIVLNGPGSVTDELTLLLMGAI
jgi:hypothetical protein